jgi:hypothetical protein
MPNKASTQNHACFIHFTKVNFRENADTISDFMQTILPKDANRKKVGPLAQKKGNYIVTWKRYC